MALLGRRSQGDRIRRRRHMVHEARDAHRQRSVPPDCPCGRPISRFRAGTRLKTGSLHRIHIDVLPDQPAQITRYEAGTYSLIGYGRQSLAPAAAVRYVSDAKLSSELSLVPAGFTYWVGFNIKTGPFAGIEAGRAGRHAFSAAIDRKALADALCSQGTSCTPATGGLISKGLVAYLGDGQDPATKFDPAAAKAEYQAWDPTGAKVKNLVYTYDTDAFNKAVCANLQLQWQK
ncbi:MAG: hypothetical protein E6J40_11665, partial [Chloroflexi bacterium]